ncbi:hypothetical protein HZA97_07805 [Candidatus Woesearchaeota archaeon]|nr:hypothetical protein [Candidatus Woesearchaeota archaeon]
MNVKGGVYSTGRLLTNTIDPGLLVGSGMFFSDTLKILSHANTSSDFIAAGVTGFAAYYLASRGLLYFKGRLGVYCTKKTTEDEKEFPFEHSEKIVFDDVEGLEMLLENTRSDHKIEWGTFFNAHDDKTNAVISNILSQEEVNQSGLILGQGFGYIMYDIAEARKKYQGFQHFHPTVFTKKLGYLNYAISNVDRFAPQNWLNFITFNLPNGPEIIGFNSRYNYIPKDKTKRELVKATPRDVKKYLKAF